MDKYILPSKPRKQQDHGKIKRLIASLQEVGAYPAITDPIKWQHEIREDRSLCVH